MPPLLVVGLGLLAIPTAFGLFRMFTRCEYTEWDFLCGPLVIAGSLAIALGIVVTVAGLGGMWDSHVCEVRGDQLGVDSKWTWATNCTVKQGDRWLDIDKYRFEIGD